MQGMDSVLGMVKREINNTQSKISLYYNNQPQTHQLHPYLQPQIQPSPLILQVPPPPPTYYYPYQPSPPQPIYYSSPPPAQMPPILQSPDHFNDSYISKTSHSPPPVTQEKAILYPLKLPKVYEDPNALKIRLAQGEIIKRQKEVNQLQRQKEGYEQFLENSTILQNQMVNYPYGNRHHALMEKIISQKCINDSNNERTLLRFQKEAEEFKKSKSKHIRYLQSLKYMEGMAHNNEESLTTHKPFLEVSPLKEAKIRGSEQKIEGRFFMNQKLEPEIQQQIDVSSSNRHLLPSDIHSHNTIETHIDTQESDNSKLIESNDYGIDSSRRRVKETKRELLPITDDGEDGLKLIRRRLIHRVQPKLKQRRHEIQSIIAEDASQLNEKSILEIKQTLRDISHIIKSNRSERTTHRRLRTQISHPPDITTKTHTEPSENPSIAKPSPNHSKITLNLPLSKSVPFEDNPPRRRLLQLCEVFD